MPRYEFRVSGEMGPIARFGFAELDADIEPAHSLLHGSAQDLARLAEILEVLRSTGCTISHIRVEERLDPSHDERLTISAVG